MKALKFIAKKAASFGWYGWSGESTKVLNELLASVGFEIMNEGFRNLWNPDEEQQQDAIEFGKNCSELMGKMVMREVGSEKISQNNDYEEE
ncbi:hypothetical protein GH810_03755 [Acetobacterium paludosum]|uniref:Uncharacterized protein n=1 Tax=Acetobacterium paludosum TaxID=52693 RepID=A0A923KRM4_9FIRM|nr:hypothetical protein [Acetobacterium paludosum]MBC3887422.1 hypothetical protein [Acetobacterium paludosum]